MLLIQVALQVVIVVTIIHLGLEKNGDLFSKLVFLLILINSSSLVLRYQINLCMIRSMQSIAEAMWPKIKSIYYVMDKGYDSEEIHSLVREELDSITMIPLRQRKRKKIKGKYRRKMIDEFRGIIVPLQKPCRNDVLCSEKGNMGKK